MIYYIKYQSNKESKKDEIFISKILIYFVHIMYISICKISKK